VVFFDALRVKIRDEATVRIKAVYLALAVLPDGSREILGIWIEQTVENRTDRGFPQRPHASSSNELYTQNSGHSRPRGHFADRCSTITR